MAQSMSRLDALTYCLAAGLDPNLLGILYPDRFPQRPGAEPTVGRSPAPSSLASEDCAEARAASPEPSEHDREEEASSSTPPASFQPAATPVIEERPAMLPVEAELPSLPLAPVAPAPPPQAHRPDPDPTSLLKETSTSGVSAKSPSNKRAISIGNSDEEEDDPVSPSADSDARPRRRQKTREFFDPSTYVSQQQMQPLTAPLGSAGPAEVGAASGSAQRTPGPHQAYSAEELGVLRRHAEQCDAIGMTIGDYVQMVVVSDFPERDPGLLVLHLGEMMLSRASASRSLVSASTPSRAAPAHNAEAGPSSTSRRRSAAWSAEEDKLLDQHIESWKTLSDKATTPLRPYVAQYVMSDYPTRSLEPVNMKVYFRVKQLGYNLPGKGRSTPTKPSPSPARARAVVAVASPRPQRMDTPVTTIAGSSSSAEKTAKSFPKPWSDEEKALLDAHIDRWAGTAMMLNAYVREIAHKDFPDRKVEGLRTYMYNRKTARRMTQARRPVALGRHTSVAPRPGPTPSDVSAAAPSPASLPASADDPSAGPVPPTRSQPLSQPPPAPTARAPNNTPFSDAEMAIVQKHVDQMRAADIDLEKYIKLPIFQDLPNRLIRPIRRKMIFLMKQQAGPDPGGEAVAGPAVEDEEEEDELDEGEYA